MSLITTKTSSSSKPAQEARENHYKLMRGYLLVEKEKFLKRYAEKKKAKADTTQYHRHETLGAGSYGRVILVRDEQSKTYYAMKVMSKRQIYKRNQIPHIVEEKRILYSVNFSYLIKLFDHAQDNSYIYLILEFINGGEMFLHLRKQEKFSESTARFYASQVVLAIEYLHYMDIIYRDLKPENILIDSKGYLKIIDMGFAKRVPKGIAYTFCGTPEYIAPEIVQLKGYNKSVDWYSLGVLIYEMTAGFTPFTAESQIDLFAAIVEGKLKFPRSFPKALKSIVGNLMERDLTKRYGNLKEGVQGIKNHEWFSPTNWQGIFRQEIPSPFIPKVKAPNDLNNFHILKTIPLITDTVNVFDDSFGEF